MLRNLWPGISVMFITSSVIKHCDYANVHLSGNHIDFVQEVKYLGVLLNSSMKTSIDVSRQARKFYTSQHATAQLSLL